MEELVLEEDHWQKEVENFQLTAWRYAKQGWEQTEEGLSAIVQEKDHVLAAAVVVPSMLPLHR